MNRVNWNGANYKDWVGLSAAPVFWVASLTCFVLGLAFKDGTGILIPGTSLDVIVFFSIGLGFANTAIQIVGNDTDKEDMGMALYLMWGASYLLGIGSNVNFLYGVIGLTSGVLQFMVCWGLGIMIEVAPERLLVKFLRAVGILKSNKEVRREENLSRQNLTQGNRQQNNGQTMGDYPTKAVNRPQYQQNSPKPHSRFPEELKRQSSREEPTWHPSTKQNEEGE